MSSPSGRRNQKTIEVDEARQIASGLVEREQLPPGFDLVEFLEDYGGSVHWGAPASGLVVRADGGFKIAVSEPRSRRARETAAELYGLYLFIGLTSGPGRQMTVDWRKPARASRQVAAAFAREFLVPGPQLRNLCELYQFGVGGEWTPEELEALAGIFDVGTPCLEVRLMEEGLRQIQGSGDA